MYKTAAFLLLACTSLSFTACAHTSPETTKPVALHTGGRVSPVTDANGPNYRQQWPGIYYEGQIKGRFALIGQDPSHVWHFYVDGKLAGSTSTDADSPIWVDTGSEGPHIIRLEKFNESQNEASSFILGPILAAATPLPAPPPRARQIEFIGDSFTVGYGNTSTTQTCTESEVWATTDTSQAFGPMTAKAFNADYQINAFSGRGIVRNYDSFVGPTLPELYPYALFDGQTVYNNPDWQPQIIVIGLGTNDFSTPVKPDDKWADTAALHTDYRRGYVAFVKELRTRNPNAHFILMSSDRFDGTLRDNVRQVADTLRAEGETRVDTLFFEGLDYGGCHFHPSLADHLKINALLKNHLTAHPELWQNK